MKKGRNNSKKKHSPEEILEIRRKQKARREKTRNAKSQRIELMHNRKSNFMQFIRQNKKALLKIIVLIFAVLLVIGTAIWFVSNDNKYKLGNTAVQYYAGQNYPIGQDAYLSRGLDDMTILVDSTGEKAMSSLVIYEEDNKMILPQDMVYYDPRNNYFKKVEALTEIICKDTGIIAKKGNKEFHLSPGFLYDGDDYYVFLEPMIANFNGYEVELSAMSYMEVIYQNGVVTFDYDSKEAVVEETGMEVTAVTDTQDYTLSLLNDLLINHDGDKMLLFTRPELLDSIFE